MTADGTLKQLQDKWLADYLAEVTGHRAGIETVRVALHRAGFVCKRPRWVLTRKAQAQPGWAKNA